jgi:aspartate ammonia-lyase
VVLKHRPLIKELKALAKSFRAKGGEFDGVIKMGRTQLQAGAYTRPRFSSM